MPRTNRSIEALFGLPVTTAWKLVNLSVSKPPAEAAKLASDLAYSTRIVRACRNLSTLAFRRGVEVVMALGQAEELRLAEQEWDTEVVPMVELFEEVTGEPWRFVRPEFSGSFSQYLREFRPLELDAELETVGGLVLSLRWQFGGGGGADAVRHFGSEASLRCRDGGVLAGHSRSSTAITSYQQEKTIHNLAYLRTAICGFMVCLFGAYRRIGQGDMPLIEALLYHFRWGQGLALPPFLDDGVQEPCYRYGSEKETITAVVAAASQGDTDLVISTSEHLRHIVRDVEPRFWRVFDARISTLLRLADRQKRLRDAAIPLPEKMRDRSGNFYHDFFEIYRIPGKPAKQRYTFLLVRDCQGDNPLAFRTYLRAIRELPCLAGQAGGTRLRRQHLDRHHRSGVGDEGGSHRAGRLFPLVG
ncbi:MAG: hypothetical protein AAB360_03930 [Patescibacteria group bacterium]